jgi:hypothetical protein
MMIFGQIPSKPYSLQECSIRTTMVHKALYVLYVSRQDFFWFFYSSFFSTTASCLYWTHKEGSITGLLALLFLVLAVISPHGRALSSPHGITSLFQATSDPFSPRSSLDVTFPKMILNNSYQGSL